MAMEMLDGFSGEERKYAIEPYTDVIRGLCWSKDIDGAKRLLFKMIDAGPAPGDAVFNIVIYRLAVTGELEEAMKMRKLMEAQGLKPGVFTDSVIIARYANAGMMEEACRVLSEAKKSHSKLRTLTWNALIDEYKELDKGIALLKEMKEHGNEFLAKVEYRMLIQSLCLDRETAEKLLEEIKERRLYAVELEEEEIVEDKFYCVGQYKFKSIEELMILLEAMIKK